MKKYLLLTIILLSLSACATSQPKQTPQAPAQSAQPAQQFQVKGPTVYTMINILLNADEKTFVPIDECVGITLGSDKMKSTEEHFLKTHKALTSMGEAYCTLLRPYCKEQKCTPVKIVRKTK